MGVFAPFVLIDRAILSVYDKIVDTAYEFDISRAMVLRVFLVLWVALDLMAAWFIDHKLGPMTFFLLGWVVVIFVRTEHESKKGNPEAMNAKILWRRERLVLFRWITYILFAIMCLMGQTEEKFPIVGFFGNFFWLSFMVVDDTFFPMGPKKRKTKEKKVKEVFTGPWAPVKT